MADDATTGAVHNTAKAAVSNGRGRLPTTREMRARKASEIAPTHVRWLWPGWLPARRLALFGGKPGDGKSGVAVDLLARASTGSAFPDGHLPPGPITCGILSAEDDPSDTLVPRLLAAGADLERVVIANGMVLDVETETQRPWVLPGDVDVLAQLIRDNSIDLFVLDPLGAFIAGQVDTHRDSSVRAMLLPLSEMARREGCSVLGIRHHRKGGATDARDAGSGSLAFTAAARIEWVAGRDPQDTTRRVLAVAKTNIGREPESLAYRLVAAECEWDTVAIAWDGTSSLTANQLVGDHGTDEDRSELEEAMVFLGEILSEAQPVRWVKNSARQAGISEITLNRAKRRMRVRSRKTPSGAWLWELRGAVDKSDVGQGDHPTGGPKHDHLDHLDHLPWSETEVQRRITRERRQGDQGDQGDPSGEDDHLPWTTPVDNSGAPYITDDDIARFEEPEELEW